MSDPVDPLLDGVPADGGGPSSRDLPGADRPEWLLPTLVVAFGALIAGLVIFGQADDGSVVTTADGPADPGVVAEEDGLVPADPDEGGSSAGATDPAQEAGEESPATAVTSGAQVVEPDGDDVAVVDPVGEAEAEEDAAAPPGSVSQDVELPGPGTIRINDQEYSLVRSCVGLQPLAPASSADVVTAHVFRPDGDNEQVVERWFTASGINGVRVDGAGAAGLRTVDVVDADVDGAFAATLEDPDGGVIQLAVNPLPEDEQDCSQLVVTNEPGQFAFPYTRAVMAACVEGDPAVDGRVVATLTEGGRMIATANGDETHTLTLRTIETLLGPPLELADPDGVLFADGDRLGYSGLLDDGSTMLDVTFDVDVSDARTCTADDG